MRRVTHRNLAQATSADTSRAHSGRRGGFTLIELLIIIAIISVILALLGAGYFFFIASQPVKNTQARLMTLNELLQKHWQKVIEDAKKEAPSADAYSMAGGDSSRAKVIWVKARLAEAFPMSFAEITNSSVYGFTDSNGQFWQLIPQKMRKYNASYLAMLGTPGPSHVKTTESAACLLMALSVDRGFGKVIDLAPMTADTDADGLGELIDDWRQPLAFFRFPTDNKTLQDAAPASSTGFLDPLDPEGRLVNPTWYSTAQRAAFEQIFHTIKGNSSNPFYTIPVIVSPGPPTSKRQGAPALNMPDMSVTNAAIAADDIYSFQQTVGAGTKP